MLLITQNSLPTSQDRRMSQHLHSKPLALEVWESPLRPRSSPAKTGALFCLHFERHIGEILRSEFWESQAVRMNKKKSQRSPAASSSPGERSPCFQLRRPHQQELSLSDEAWICRSGVGGGEKKHFWKYLSHRWEQQVRDMQIKLWKPFKNLNNVSSMEVGCK